MEDFCEELHVLYALCGFLLSKDAGFTCNYRKHKNGIKMKNLQKNEFHKFDFKEFNEPNVETKLFVQE